MASERPTDAAVQVCSVQTLTAREQHPPADLIVWDEAHHCAAETYRDIRAQYPAAWHLGLTATPERSDGAPLGDAGVVAPQHEPRLVGERESDRVLNLPLAHADLLARGQKPKRSLNLTIAHPGLYPRSRAMRSNRASSSSRSRRVEATAVTATMACARTSTRSASGHSAPHLRHRGPREA